MAMLKPHEILIDLLLRVENALPAAVHTMVTALPISEFTGEGMICKSFPVEIDDIDRNMDIDQFGQRYLAPIAALFANILIPRLCGTDTQAVFFRLPPSGGNIWAEEVRSRRAAIRLIRRYPGDACHFDIAFIIRKIEKEVAA